MIVYADLVVLLNFSVDLLLLAATDRLAGHHVNWKRAALASLIGAIYAGACIYPQLAFLGNLLWRIASLFVMSWICFGWSISALRRGCLFSLLSMALGGIALAMNKRGIWSLFMASAGVWAMCTFGFRGKTGQAEYVRAEIEFYGEKYCFTALRDTGNHLSDPMTGHRVLLVDADLARKIGGFTRTELQNPIMAMEQGRLPGLRLIPYRAVGKPMGMLLGLRVDKVVIDGRPSGHVIAFAPDVFSGEKAYQALTGGVL